MDGNAIEVCEGFHRLVLVGVLHSNNMEAGIDKQNVTLSLPRDVLHKVELLAAQREISVSELLTSELERLVAQEESYARARQRHLRLLEKGLNLGTHGQIHTTRDELHERR